MVVNGANRAVIVHPLYKHTLPKSAVARDTCTFQSLPLQVLHCVAANIQTAKDLVNYERVSRATWYVSKRLSLCVLWWCFPTYACNVCLSYQCTSQVSAWLLWLQATASMFLRAHNATSCVASTQSYIPGSFRVQASISR